MQWRCSHGVCCAAVSTTERKHRNRYTAEQRADALRLYQLKGPHAASRETDIPAATISSWAKRSGIRMVDVKTRYPREAIEELRAKRGAIREELQLRMLATALHLVERIDEPHVDYLRGADGIEAVTYQTAPAKAAQAYSVAAGILLDKYRLELGEATERSESGPVTPVTAHLSDEEQRKLRDWIDGLDITELPAEPVPVEA